MIRQMIQNIQKGILHMETINPQEWKQDLPAFKEKTDQFYAGELSKADYKGFSGGYGSYAQKDGKASMIRLRMSGGHLTKDKLKFIADSIKTYNHASADRIGKGIEKLIQQIRKADPAIDILLVSPIELGEDVWKPGFDPEFDQHSVKVSKELKQTYLKIAWKYGCDFLAASDVAKPSKADMEHMNEKGHKNLAKAIESFLVEKERNHSNNYVNVV